MDTQLNEPCAIAYVMSELASKPLFVSFSSVRRTRLRAC